DFQEVDGEVLQVAERRKPGAEVVEREPAAYLLQRVNEAVRLRIARDGGRLGDLEADASAVEAAALELLDDERQELLVRETLPGQVDRAERKPLPLVCLRHKPAEGLRDDPAIDGRRQAVALGRGDEELGRDQRAV